MGKIRPILGYAAGTLLLLATMRSLVPAQTNNGVTTWQANQNFIQTLINNTIAAISWGGDVTGTTVNNVATLSVVKIRGASVANTAPTTSQYLRYNYSGNYAPYFEYVDVKDYGAKCDGVTNDTTALNNAFSAATSASVYVCAPTGSTCLGTNLLFGTNATGGVASAGPIGIGPCGGNGGNFGGAIFKEYSSSATGTFFKATGLSGRQFNNILIDCDSAASVTPCIDTTNTVSPYVQDNLYSGLTVQNFSGVGWEALDNNESHFTFDTIRQGTAGQSEVYLDLTATPGSCYLDHVYTLGGILDISCQDATVLHHVGYGIRFNQNGTSTDNITVIGGQEYVNTSSGYAYWDASPATSGHYLSDLTATGNYVILTANNQAIFNFRVASSLNLFSFTATPTTSTWNYDLLGNGFTGVASDLGANAYCESCALAGTGTIAVQATPNNVNFFPLNVYENSGHIVPIASPTSVGTLASGSTPVDIYITWSSTSSLTITPGIICAHGIIPTFNDATGTGTSVTSSSATQVVFSGTSSHATFAHLGCR